MTKFRCWVADDGDEDDGRDAEGFDPAHAAQNYVADRERRGCEYHVAGGGEIEVSVRVESEVHRYHVTGWPEPTYHATRLT